MKDDARPVVKPGPTRYSAAVERAEQRAAAKRHCCNKYHCANDDSCGLSHDSSHRDKPQPSPVVYTFLEETKEPVKETRVDIKREGWTSGTDTPLPKACQLATCIHKEHQLSRDTTHDVPWKTLAELDKPECDCIPAGARVDLHEAAGTLRAELARICPEHGEKAEDSYRDAVRAELCLMSLTPHERKTVEELNRLSGISYSPTTCTDECDEHHTKGPGCLWHVVDTEGWCAPTACAVGICTNSDKHDPDCKGPGWGYVTPKIYGPVLDLPTISVKRGGIRRSRVRLSIKREGWREWYVLATVDASVAFIGPFKNRKKAESAQSTIRSITNALEGLQ